jgi:TolB-like protein/Tfp pilus assembly protein PilF
VTSLFEELKRRRVFKVLASYAVVAWLLIQIVVTVADPLGLPAWSKTLVIVALAIGFPVCAALAWVYDITAHGVERTAAAAAGSAHDAAPAKLDRWWLTIAAAAIVLVVLTGSYLVIEKPAPAFDRLAILPFENRAADDATRYLGDGIRDSLVTRISRIAALKLVSTDATGQTNARELGRLLGVAAIVLGSVAQRGDTLEIVARLLDTRDGSILWQEEYSSEASSLLTIERTIATEVAHRLRLPLSADETAAIARMPTSNPAAHRLYLQGRYFWNRRTAEGFAASIDYYDRAIALDPTYALAYAGLANTYLMILAWGIQPPAAVAQKVVDAAEEAIRLDPTLAEPHATLGYLKTIYDRDWNGAQAHFLRAIELNNNYSSAHHWYAFLLWTKGEVRAAVEEIELARESEPLSPVINAEVPTFYLAAGEYERALEELKRALLLDPNYPPTLAYLGRAYALLGRRAEGVEEMRRWRELASGDVNLGFGGMPLPLLGRAEELREIYGQLLEGSRERYIMPGLLGVVAAALGDNDAAFAHFEAGLEDRSLILSWLRDPLILGIRDDPRYAALFKRVGLEP